jgi:hypothetical protein
MITILSCVCLFAAGCGDDKEDTSRVVGGQCAADSDCAQGSVCLTSKSFPSGSCAAQCTATNPRCPEQSECVEIEKKARCVATCSYPKDCRSGYTCKGHLRINNDGEALICISAAD